MPLWQRQEIQELLREKTEVSYEAQQPDGHPSSGGHGLVQDSPIIVTH